MRDSKGILFFLSDGTRLTEKDILSWDARRRILRIIPKKVPAPIIEITDKERQERAVLPATPVGVPAPGANLVNTTTTPQLPAAN